MRIEIIEASRPERFLVGRSGSTASPTRGFRMTIHGVTRPPCQALGEDPLRSFRALIAAHPVSSASPFDVHDLFERLGILRCYSNGNGGSDAGWRAHSDKVYFLRNERSRSYKIGVSHNPSVRIGQIRSEYRIADDLRLVAVAWGTYVHEAALHRKFDALRRWEKFGPTWSPTEWFDGAPELVRYIASLIADDIAWCPEKASP